jgi:hypothetical protein
LSQLHFRGLLSSNPGFQIATSSSGILPTVGSDKHLTSFVAPPSRGDKTSANERYIAWRRRGLQARNERDVSATLSHPLDTSSITGRYQCISITTARQHIQLSFQTRSRILEIRNIKLASLYLLPFYDRSPSITFLLEKAHPISFNGGGGHGSNDRVIFRAHRWDGHLKIYWNVLASCSSSRAGLHRSSRQRQLLHFSGR